MSQTINDNVDRSRSRTTKANQARTAGRAARMVAELVDRDLVPLLDDKQLLDLGAAVMHEMAHRFPLFQVGPAPRRKGGRG